MAGLHRRTFINIISDKFIDHYQGRVAKPDLDEVLQKLAVMINRLDDSRKNGRSQRAETLRKLKKFPLERLQKILSAEA